MEYIKGLKRRIWDDLLLLVFKLSLLASAWISDESPLRVYILLLSVWISDKTLLLVFGYQMKHSSPSRI